MEFTFDNNIPIYIQLLNYMKIYLISGVFKAGEKLPSVREFAIMNDKLLKDENDFLKKLERMRKFYIYFSIATTLLTQLNWSHYLDLIKIEEEKKNIELNKFSDDI